MNDEAHLQPPPGALRRNVLRILAIVLVAWSLHRLLGWATDLVELGDRQLWFWMLAGFLLVYALLIAMPFVPGVEVGLTLMAMEGPWIAPWIYLATVTGLTAAFAAGEWLPYARLHRMLADLHLHRACHLIEKVQPLARQERLRLMQGRAPAWARPFVTRYRYVLLALVINLPGNAVVGGGGGLMFMAGFSRLYQPFATVITIALAVVPVPVAVWVFGVDVRGLFG